MEYRQLGNSDIRVSEICLGSMTWGTQNSTAEAHAQIEFALDHGVNFIDTAELAIAFCNQRLFVTSSIIGATSLDQLEVNIGAADLDLDAEVLEDIQTVYRNYPIPY